MQGNYYALPKTQIEKLGVNASDYQLATFYKPVRSVQVLESTAADFEGVINGVNIKGKGGAIQYFSTDKEAFLPTIIR